MSFHRIGSVVSAGFFALAIALPGAQTKDLPRVTLAQATQPAPAPATTAPATTVKSKAKKKKTTNSGAAGGDQSQPPVHVGPPDPGKY